MNIEHIGGPVTSEMPNPTPEELDSPEFEAIWRTIRSWDVNAPDCYHGYCGANGSHVVMILRALKEVPDAAGPTPVR